VLGALPLAIAPAAAQTGHDKACLVVDNETDRAIKVWPPQGSPSFGMPLMNVGAHKRGVATLMGIPLTSPDWSKVQVEPASGSLSWAWDGDFHRAPGFEQNETCDGAWVLTVR